MNNLKFENFSNALGEFQLSMKSDYFEFSKRIDSIRYIFGGSFKIDRNKLICNQFNAGICFEELEDFIIPTLVEAQVLGKSAIAKEQWTVKISKNHLLGKSKFDLAVYDEIEYDKSKISEFQSKIEEAFEGKVQLFFSEWTSIRELQDPFQKLNINECTNVLGDAGIFKKLYVLRKYNRERYDIFFDFLINNFLEASKNDPYEVLFKRYNHAVNLLGKKLESTFN
ncbi:MAG: hypothetical protein AAFQ94_25570 [Bacteroidota bacterium]